MPQASLNKKYLLSITDSPCSGEKQKSCRMSNNETKDNDDDTDIEESLTATDSTTGSNNKQTKRIRFQNGTRRTITERKA